MPKKVGDALPICRYTLGVPPPNKFDPPTRVPFSDGDTLQLDSYYIDASGSTTKTNIKVHFRPDIFELLRKCHRIIRYPLDDCLHYSSINTNWRDYAAAV